MNFRVREVNGSENRLLLQKMQEVCLPETWVYPVTRGWWWLALDAKGIPAGFGALSIIDGCRYGYLCRAGVLPTYRGHRLQERLIRVREQKAKALGLTILVTDTSDNPPSANSLIRCGFKTYTPQQGWGFRHTIYWMKNLVDPGVIPR